MLENSQAHHSLFPAPSSFAEPEDSAPIEDELLNPLSTEDEVVATPVEEAVEFFVFIPDGDRAEIDSFNSDLFIPYSADSQTFFENVNPTASLPPTGLVF